MDINELDLRSAPDMPPAPAYRTPTEPGDGASRPTTGRQMHGFRHLGHAPQRWATARWRLAVTAGGTMLGFVIGVVVPDARMLTGATTAILVVALLQLVFIIIDSKTGSTSKDPERTP